jgi:crossover junction endodeoxyribonuclease RuvC
MTRLRHIPSNVMAGFQKQNVSINAPQEELRVLGIDASLRSTGIGVIDYNGTSMKYIDGLVIKNKANAPLSACLFNLSSELEAYIDKHKPVHVAIEGIFYSRNARTALLLGHARGVLIETCSKAALPIYEYAPRKIKQAVTGMGTATKEQIQHMMMRVLNLEKLPQEDVGDALAIAITHIHNMSGIASLAPKPI